VFGVLQVVLGKHRVAGGLRVARQLHVFLGDMRRIATDFNVRPGRFEAARERILALAVVIVVAAAAVIAAAVAMALVIVAPATASAVILLSLPHGLPFSVWFEISVRDVRFEICRAYRPRSRGHTPLSNRNGDMILKPHRHIEAGWASAN
jgi:hypothetical protein